MVGWLYAPYTHLSDYPNIGEKRTYREKGIIILYSYFYIRIIFFLLTGTLPYTVFYFSFFIQYLVCKFRPQESQSDVLGDLRRMVSLVVGSYFGMPPLRLPGLELASPGTPNVLTRVRCLSLKPDMDREVCSHPDSRISNYKYVYFILRFNIPIRKDKNT